MNTEKGKISFEGALELIQSYGYVPHRRLNRRKGDLYPAYVENPNPPKDMEKHHELAEWLDDEQYSVLHGARKSLQNAIVPSQKGAVTAKRVKGLTSLNELSHISEALEGNDLNPQVREILESKLKLQKQQIDDQLFEGSSKEAKMIAELEAKDLEVADLSQRLEHAKRQWEIWCQTAKQYEPYYNSGVETERRLQSAYLLIETTFTEYDKELYRKLLEQLKSEHPSYDAFIKTFLGYCTEIGQLARSSQDAQSRVAELEEENKALKGSNEIWMSTTLMIKSALQYLLFEMYKNTEEFRLGLPKVWILKPAIGEEVCPLNFVVYPNGDYTPISDDEFKSLHRKIEEAKSLITPMREKA